MKMTKRNSTTKKQKNKRNSKMTKIVIIDLASRRNWKKKKKKKERNSKRETNKEIRASKMVSASVARNTVGVIGNVISFGLFFSPAPTFYGIIKKKAVEEFKPDPYLATLLNCAFWVFYGMPFVHPKSILVLTINAVGLVFEFVYLTIFYIYATNKGRKKVLLFLVIETIFFAAVVLITMLALHGTHNRSMVVGVLCDVFNVMMYVSPLTIMAKVIRTKSVKYMPFWLSLTNFLNGVCWTTYALIHPFDLYVLISNGIGAVSGLVQLILYACYCSRKEENNDENNNNNDLKPSGVQLSNLNNGRVAV